MAGEIRSSEGHQAPKIGEREMMREFRNDPQQVEVEIFAISAQTFIEQSAERTVKIVLKRADNIKQLH